MSCENSRHYHHRVRRGVKKQVLFLSRSAIDLWHQCRTRALETIEKGKRFSLISCSDYQATFAAQYVRNKQYHRRSVPSEQIFGFHVVCAECEGFVVRNGVVRNCAHQRGSWSSIISSRSREVRGGAARNSNVQAMDDVRISVQPPTLGSSSEPGTRGKGHGSAGIPSGGMAGSEEEWSRKQKVREAVPAILRPGYVADERDARTISSTGKVVRSDRSLPSGVPDRVSGTDEEGTDLSICAGKAAQKTRLCLQEETVADSGSVDGESTNKRLRNPDALMRNWKDWSESWEKSVTRVKSRANNTGDTDRAHCDPDALMREWREWSTKWERLVTSR